LNSLRIVERSPAAALRHYLHQQNISLPHAYSHDALQLVVQALMEIEVSQLVAAAWYERKSSRRAYRNGFRDSVWSTRHQTIALRIPKLRRGTYYPAFLENPQTENTISEFVTQAYLAEIQFADVAHLLQTLTINTTPDKIAELHADLYDLVASYRARQLDVERVRLDLLPIEEHGRKRYLALAIGAHELLDHDITHAADTTFWQDFIRRIDERTVRRVEYITLEPMRHMVRLSKVDFP
jgi:putative transposase